MTSKDLSIFNSLRPFSIGFDDMFDQFENMLGNGSLTMQSNHPPYNIRKTGKDNYAIEVALACLLYTSPSPRDRVRSRMPSSA